MIPINSLQSFREELAERRDRIQAAGNGKEKGLSRWLRDSVPVIKGLKSLVDKYSR